MLVVWEGNRVRDFPADRNFQVFDHFKLIDVFSLTFALNHEHNQSLLITPGYPEAALAHFNKHFLNNGVLYRHELHLALYFQEGAGSTTHIPEIELPIPEVDLGVVPRNAVLENHDLVEGVAADSSTSLFDVVAALVGVVSLPDYQLDRLLAGLVGARLLQSCEVLVFGRGLQQDGLRLHQDRLLLTQRRGFDDAAERELTARQV